MFYYRGLVLLAVLFGVVACGPPTRPAAVRGGAAASRAAEFRQVDSIFSRWTRADAAGCALGVLRGGQLLYSHGYGLADIEHAVPITAATAFDVGSISNQFTALAVYLLAQEGKLSIDDDIRGYLPELPDFHQTITIGQLLHHTSGLRDQSNLVAMAGWRMQDALTQQDILKLTWRQQELNFPPGQESLYSSTDYTLLALIVQRVAAMSLRDFTDKRVFAPLGMAHSRFQQPYGDLVPNRAYPYQLQPGGEQYLARSYSTLGPSDLFTSVEDLARWVQNFYDGSVGGKDLLARMQINGALTDGSAGHYASGLVIGQYRGVETLEQGGDAGSGSDVLRFPDAQVAVIVLCNAADADASALAHRTADVVLSAELKSPPPGVPQPDDIPVRGQQRSQLPSEQLQQYDGVFYSAELDKSYSVSTHDGKLFIGDLRGEAELIPTHADAFEAAFPFSTVDYECTRTRRCNSFVVSNAGVRRLRFQRISLIPTAVVKLPEGAARVP